MVEIDRYFSFFMLFGLPPKTSNQGMEYSEMNSIQ